MKKYALTSLFIILCSISVFSQTNNEKEIKAKCPTISITPPPAAVRSGQSMQFSVLLDKTLKKLDLKYKWRVDKGTIIKGQGTKKIVVATDGLNDTTITASVEIKGLPTNCSNKFSETGIVAARPPICDLDEFGELSINDIKNRVDNFLVELHNDPDSTGVILNYGMPKDVTKRVNIIKDHIKFRNFDLSRIHFRYVDVEKHIRTKLRRIPEGVDDSELN